MGLSSKPEQGRRSLTKDPFPVLFIFDYVLHQQPEAVAVSLPFGDVGIVAAPHEPLRSEGLQGHVDYGRNILEGGLRLWEALGAGANFPSPGTFM